MPISSASDLIGVDIRFGQRFDQRRALGSPDFHRVVFDPAWLRINLFKFSLGDADDIGYPKPGWVEHDPMEIWASQSSTLVEALAKADINSDQIAAIGITNQRETVVEKYGSTTRPVALRIYSSIPSRLSCSQISAVRRHCQTIAL